MRPKQLVALMMAPAALVVVFYPSIISAGVFVISLALKLPHPYPFCHGGGG